MFKQIVIRTFTEYDQQCKELSKYLQKGYYVKFVNKIKEGILEYILEAKFEQ